MIARTQNAFGRYFRIQIEMTLERHGGYSRYVGRKGLDNLYVFSSSRLILKNSVINPLPVGPRFNLTSHFQRPTAQSIYVLKICKKYVSLGFYLESVGKSLYWLNKA